MTRINARILGHDGQTLIKEMIIEEPLPYLKVAIPPKRIMAVEEPDLTALGVREAEVYYERTDGGGTRIYRLKVNL